MVNITNKTEEINEYYQRIEEGSKHREHKENRTENFAIIHPSFILSPLFTTLRVKTNTEVEYIFNDIRFKFSNRLNTHCQTIFLYLQSKALKKRESFHHLDNDIIHYLFRDFITIYRDELSKYKKMELEDILIVKTSINELLRVVRKRANHSKYLESLLVSLCGTSVEENNFKKNIKQEDVVEGKYRLMNALKIGKSTLYIALNPRMSRVNTVVNGKRQQYVKIDLDEREKLESDIAKLLHTKFSGLTKENSYFKISINNLMKNIYLLSENDNYKQLVHYYKRKILFAINEINQKLKNWNIEYDNNIITIYRI